MSDRHVAYALIGGGLAAGNCARWLRESGADGSILLIGRESDLPYNRPPCSKGYLQGKESREDVLFRPAQWYEEQQIEALTRVSAMKLDPAEKVVTLSNRETVSFDQALVATGANVKRLNVEGSELEGIHYLRALGNSDTIRGDAAGKRVVLIGGSYIASEVAASLTELGSSCTLVMLESVVLSRGFGEPGGPLLPGSARGARDHRLRRRRARALRGRRRARHPRDHQGRARARGRRGRDGDRRDARRDARSRGRAWSSARAAASPSTPACRPPPPGIYAAGDVAEYESVVHGGRRMRIEHWDVAFNQGKTAALNMLGASQPHDVVPYFFSDLSDWASLEYVGPAARMGPGGRPRLDSRTASSSIFYLHEGRVAGALSVGRSDDLEHARRLLVGGQRHWRPGRRAWRSVHRSCFGLKLRPQAARKAADDRQ